MVDPTHLRRSVFVIGANHRTSGLSLRDRLFVDDADIPDFLAKISKLGVDDLVVLSTCDRVEIHGTHPQPDAVYRDVLQHFATHAGLKANELLDNFYLHQDAVAVRHIFSVASSLDSLVVGEPQVLGQLKAAHQISRKAGHVSGPLEPLLQSAYRVAKRIRTETRIGERPVSIASSACEIARGLHGDLSRVYVALVGAGEMGEMIAKQFMMSNVKGLSVSHPSLTRAEPLAARLSCHVVPYEELSQALSQADVIISAIGRRQHSLSADMVRSALKSRRNRPQLIIDTAIPGDVDPAVNRIDDAFLYELADLDRVAVDGQSSRKVEADVATRLLEEEVQKFVFNASERDAAPVLSQLRSHFRSVQQDVVEQHPDDVTRATALLISKLLHKPAQVLRERARAGDGTIEDAEQILNELFDLDKSSRPDQDN